MKKSFSLFESFIVLILFSLIFYTVIDLTSFINHTKNTQYQQTKSLIDLESTRIFLENKRKTDQTLNLLSFEGDILYYNNSILLKDVISFELLMYNNKTSYTICIKSFDTLCQEYALRE